MPSVGRITSAPPNYVQQRPLSGYAMGQDKTNTNHRPQTAVNRAQDLGPASRNRNWYVGIGVGWNLVRYTP